MRDLIIIRENKIEASLVSPEIILDDEVVGKVKNGEGITLSVDEDSHEIMTYVNQNRGSIIRVQPGDEDIILYLKYEDSEFRLYSDSQLSIDSFDENTNNESEEERYFPETYGDSDQTGPIACGIIISLALIILGLYIYSIGQTTLTQLIFSMIFSIASGTVMIMGGFWFIVIPLPYIAIWKAGCKKPYQPTSRKVLLGILAVVFPILVFISLFGF